MDALLPLLFGDKHQVFAAALRELTDSSIDELARLRGLLLWLAWDCNLSRSRPAEFFESDDRLLRRLQERAAMLCLTSEVVTDDLAVKEAKRSIQGSASTTIAKRALSWIEDNLSWGAALARIRTSLDTGNSSPSNDLDIGSIVYRIARDDFRVVASFSGTTASLVSLGLKEPDIRWNIAALRPVFFESDGFQSQLRK